MGGTKGGSVANRKMWVNPEDAGKRCGRYETMLAGAAGGILALR